MQPSGILLNTRDCFLIDPFFQTARETLERCLQEIQQKHQEVTQGLHQALITGPVTLTGPVSVINPIPWLAFCGTCGCPRDETVARLGNWAPAALIPCLSCNQAQTGQKVQQLLEHQASINQYFQQLAEQHAQRLQEVQQLAQHTAQELASGQCKQLLQQFGQQLLPPPKGNLTLFSDNFELILDVHGFTPQELNINVKDDWVEVNAQKVDQTGPECPYATQRTQAFLKRYKLPRNVNSDMVQCNISSDGILVITAPWKM